jgi:hypothetical protein
MSRLRVNSNRFLALDFGGDEGKIVPLLREVY